MENEVKQTCYVLFRTVALQRVHGYNHYMDIFTKGFYSNYVMFHFRMAMQWIWKTHYYLPEEEGGGGGADGNWENLVG